MDNTVASAHKEIDEKLVYAGTVVDQCQAAGAECVNQIQALTANAVDTENRMNQRIDEANGIKEVLEAEHVRVQGEIRKIYTEVTDRDRESERHGEPC